MKHTTKHAEITHLVRNGLLIVLIAFVGVGGWAAFAPLSGAIVASGVVKVDSNRKTVQHLEGGIVKEILVRNGDKVKQGQPLLVIADAAVSANVELLQAQLDAEQAKESRLLAERAFKSPSFPEALLQRAKSDVKVAKIIQSETQLFNTRLEALNSQVRLIRQQIEQLKQETASISAQIQSEEQAISYMQEDLNSNQALLEKKFIQKSRLLTLQRDLADHQALRSEHVADLSRARQKSMDLELRIITLRNEYMQQAAHDLEESTRRIREVQEKLTPSLDAMKRQQIVAPVDGEVVGLAVHTVGGVIGAKEPLMEIVPTNGKLIIEARVNVEDIEEVRPQAPVDIHFSAYSQRSASLGFGHVSYIAADRSQDEQTKVPYYIVQVTVDEKHLAETNRHDLSEVKLTPGMPTEIFIKTQSRTALQYLLEPITNSIRRSLRET